MISGVGAGAEIEANSKSPQEHQEAGAVLVLACFLGFLGFLGFALGSAFRAVLPGIH